MSLTKLLDLISGRPDAQQTRTHHDPLRLATAGVLLDIASADGDFHPAQDGDVPRFLADRFGLSEQETAELIDSADETRRKMVDHFAFTNHIRKNMDFDGRVDLVRTMWRLVFSDGTLSEYENYLVRKLSDLLGIEHHVMIDIKSAVMREMGR